jgi:hypothetical protein
MSNGRNVSAPPGGRGGWWSNMKRSEQIAAAVVGAVIAGTFVVVAALISRSSGSPSSTPPHDNSHAMASSSSQVKKSIPAPLAFLKPPNWEAEGKVIEVTLTGTIPRSEYLWIFVYHAGRYYVQGTPASQESDLWSLPAVNLGSTLPSDINSWYTVYAVQANQQANKAIQMEYSNENDLNYGMAVIPGGNGAEKIAYMNLYRTH